MPETETTPPKREDTYLSLNDDLFRDIVTERLNALSETYANASNEEQSIVADIVASGVMGAKGAIATLERSTFKTIGTQTYETKTALAMIAVGQHRLAKKQQARADDLSSRLDRYRIAVGRIRAAVTSDTLDPDTILRMISECVSEGDETHLS